MKHNYSNSHTRIKIRMKRSFNKFDKERKNEFIDDLESVVGYPQSEFVNVQFRKGCVIFDGEVPTEGAKRILELYLKRNTDGANYYSDELEEFRLFLEKHNIIDITDDFTIRVFVKTRKKGVKRALVFIHGWRGDTSSFGDMPDYLSKKFNAEKFIYNYPTGLISHSPRLNKISKNFDNQIRVKFRDHKFALIAHSMGGLISRKFIVLQKWRNEPLDDFVKQITFIASPHNGSVLAKIGKKIPGVWSKQMEDLSPDSVFLDDLNEQWTYWVLNNAKDRTMVRSIYGTKDDIVFPENAKGLDPEAVPILGANHQNIVKPKTENDEVVETVKYFLEKSNF